MSVVELLAVVAMLALMLGVAIPAISAARGRVATAAAARRLANEFQGQRWRSLAQGSVHGLRFEPDHRGRWSWYRVRDGNGNGLRSRELAEGTDLVLSGPHPFPDGAQPGLPPGGSYPEIPPGGGWIDPAGDPVRFGAADLVSFGRLGGASSGRIYLTDGREELWAVVLFGRTGRIRVWRYDVRTGRWTR